MRTYPSVKATVTWRSGRTADLILLPGEYDLLWLTQEAIRSIQADPIVEVRIA